MTKKPGEAAAFPLITAKVDTVGVEVPGHGWHQELGTVSINYLYDGLTKRELFAAMAMQGLLSNAHFNEFRGEYAVHAADALIKALEETEDGDG